MLVLGCFTIYFLHVKTELLLKNIFNIRGGFKCSNVETARAFQGVCRACPERNVVKYASFTSIYMGIMVIKPFYFLG